MPFRYIDHTMNPTPLRNQVGYGPVADIPAHHQAQLLASFGTPAVLHRITQYNQSHLTYVAAAQGGGRPLTIQENDALRRRGQAANASINHVIASGTGQSILNEGALQFHAGVAAMAPAVDRPPPGPLDMLRGLALQAAAVGRQQGYSRAIINERVGEIVPSNPDNRRIYGAGQTGVPLNPLYARHRALRHTLSAFQGPDAATRFRSYRDVLRMTFDSPGNLRVGDNYGNNLASTGFDMPLNARSQATGRGFRLLQAHSAFASDRLLTPDRLFTRDATGNRISSSIEGMPRGATQRRARSALESGVDGGEPPRKRAHAITGK